MHLSVTIIIIHIIILFIFMDNEIFRIFLFLIRSQSFSHLSAMIARRPDLLSVTTPLSFFVVIFVFIDQGLNHSWLACLIKVQPHYCVIHGYTHTSMTLMTDAGRQYDNINDDKTRTWSFLPPWWRRQQRCEATVGFHCSSLDGRLPPGVWCYHGGDRMENNNNMKHLEEVSVKALTVIVRPLHCPSHLSGQPFKDVFIW